MSDIDDLIKDRWMEGLPTHLKTVVKHYMNCKTKEELLALIEKNEGKIPKTRGLGKTGCKKIYDWLWMEEPKKPVNMGYVNYCIKLLNRYGYEIYKDGVKVKGDQL